jgi:copper/silver efflux system protein
MVSRVIELCAKHRGLVLAGVAAAAAVAVVAVHRVPLDALPDLSEPQVIVYTEWMGRSPTLVEDQITYPLVSSLHGAPRVAEVRGQSMFGMSFVYVIFEEGTDLDWARARVLEHLATRKDALPADANPRLGPAATGVGWTFQYTLVDRTGRRGLDELRTFQDFTLRHALSSVPGVAEVASVGGYEKQYQVVVDPNRLRAHEVTLQDVVSAIRESSEDVGGRVLELAGREYYVRGRGYVHDPSALERVVLKARGPLGAPVLVSDVGTVRFGPEIRRGLLEWNGEGEAVGAVVVMRSGEDALAVIDRVKGKIAELERSFPPGVELEIAYDRSDLIHRAIATLRRALVEEALVVLAVVALFLLHARSAVLPVLSIPVALAIAFIPMWLLGIPATIMSLGGVAIAVGATVDAEVVMIEASHKKLEHAPAGADRARLLAEAAREVTPAIFFSLLVIAVSFLPVFALTGRAGRLFRPLAWTKTFVMLSAALLSITFAPALRGLLLRGRIRPESRHPVSRAIIRLYRPFVYVALRRPKSTVLIGLLAILSAVPLAASLGHEFMPPLDEGDLLYMPTTLPGISVEEAKRALQSQDRMLRSFPEVASVSGKVGRAETATDPAPLSMAETTVRLRAPSAWRRVPHPRWWSGWTPGWLARPLRALWPDRRRITRDELVAEMNRRMAFPGWTNAFTMPIKGRVDMLTTGVRTPLGVKVMGSDLEAIERVGVALERVLAPVPGTRSVYYERNTGGTYVDVVPDRDALARHGLRVADVQRTVEAAIGGSPVATTVEGRNRFSINVRYPQDLRADLDGLRQLPVAVPVGADAGDVPGMAQGRASMSPQRGAAAADPARGPAAMASMGGGAAAARAPGAPAPRAAPAAAAGSSPFAGLDAVGRPSLGDAALLRPPPAFARLGELADVRIVNGPPMLRDEGGHLVGYVYVDVDPQRRDLAGYVADAKAAVRAALDRGALVLPEASFLRWTGEYELLEQTRARMKLLVPLTLAIVALLLYLHFRNVSEVLVVLLSIPFALVGSVWLLWALDYRLSTAVWVGILALVGLAAQTGIVMIVYIDNAYERRRRAGRIRDLDDIVWAHLEGTVLRVRPKLMTVATMLLGLLPLLWATGSGADVMKRIAAPMVGGLLTSAFLTLEIIPVLYTYWRLEQLLWERLSTADPRRLRSLRRWRAVQGAGWAAVAAILASTAYVDWPKGLLGAGLTLGGGAALAGGAVYLAIRRSAPRAAQAGRPARRYAAIAAASGTTATR